LQEIWKSKAILLVQAYNSSLADWKDIEINSKVKFWKLSKTSKRIQANEWSKEANLRSVWKIRNMGEIQPGNWDSLKLKNGNENSIT
jgi:hypothetical protein